MKPRSQLLFDEAFSKPRDPRSSAYREGVVRALQFKCGEISTIGRCGYLPGSAELDAWLSGLDEGFLLVRREQEAILDNG